MSDSNKRILLTVVACVAILVLWQVFSPKSKAPVPKDKGKQAQKGKKTPSEPSGDPASQPATPASQPAAAASQPSRPGAGPTTTSIEGEHHTLKTKEALGKLTTRGAALRSWKLTDPRYKEIVKGKLVPVDLVQTLAKQGPWPLETTFLRADSDFQVPANAAFTRVKGDAREVLYRWESDKVRVTKHFVADKTRPLLWLTLKVRNKTDRPLRQRLQIDLYNRQDSGQGKAGFTNPFPKQAMVLCHVNGELHRRTAAGIRGEDSGCSAAGCGMGEGEVSVTGEVLWIGSGDSYFLTAIVPQNRDESRRCLLKVDKNEVTQAALQFSSGRIDAGKAMTRKFAVYVGPKYLDQLDAITGPDEDEVKLSESINYGWFAILCRPMLWLLKVFQTGVGNWGIAIILLTLVVKLLTLYWTQKSMRSMRAMQRLKPRIDVLREKFKDDKQRLNTEMMALYKVHKVNPLGGCLPMVIQMPVWFALYRTLLNSVELYHSTFIPGWLNDLTSPDPYYILPVAMGAAMFAQQAITPQPLEGTQAKMMKYFMPIMFTVMMLQLPSGLTLYIFINTVLTMLHQYYMNKTDKGGPIEPVKPAADGEAANKHRKKPKQQPEEQSAERPKPKPKRRKRKKRS
jgi:YidC/Oxa1 family membrane protein insertase